ncbi:putative tRNA-splicing endonuclease subunit Sen2 [Apostichopus japonicus]|uniref:tRNA-splicing endonuclease subunit Sen2 n=1 Tax=Stichopus japonicus TaxID=307972 RepID=A0A2G8JCK0_STIJA|nr:putative tRNA-splicing endonuclease subunit Sen2 [Apostichopus japonicus]
MLTGIGLRDDVMKVKCLTGNSDIRCSSDDDCRMKKDKQLEQQSQVSKSDTELTQFKVLDESNVGHQQTKLRNSKSNETQNQKRHRQEDKEKTQKMKSKQVIRKPDPYPVQEFLQLSYEESFFLSYGLGCLTLLKPSTTSAEETPMNLVDIWKEFLILKPRFPATYACYHYYRSKGWVPRCGIKYGCDFVVYKKGPSFYHSSFAVLAHLVEEGSEMTSALASWYNFTGFSRIIENAAKDIILCYVTYPEEFTELHLKSPACIPHLKVHEICMKRWRPTRERELKEDYPP